MKNKVRKTGKILLIVIAFIAIVVVASVETIDRKALADHDYFKATKVLMDSLHLNQFPSRGNIRVGWSARNITPKSAAIAGYRPRKSFSSVLDSLFCRVITISNGSARVSLISLDLLITPPSVKKAVEQKIAKGAISTLPYFSAVHTHNSIGNWDSSLAGSIIVGEYDSGRVNAIADAVVTAIKESIINLQPARIEYYKTPIPELVFNRLNSEAITDHWLRGLKISRADSSVGYLATFAAHPTNLPMKSRYLSAEYPGRLVKYLNQEADFAMFMAGMVGSHSLTGIEGSSEEVIDKAGEVLSEKVLDTNEFYALDTTVAMVYKQIKLPLQHARLRLAGKWQLRDWVFQKGFGQLSASVTVFQIGKLVFLSMPGDFSGELYQNHIAGKHKDLEIIITSFNGDFAGYIIDDQHYWKSKKDEANVMNWLGPHGGEYFAFLTNSILKKLKDHSL